MNVMFPQGRALADKGLYMGWTPRIGPWRTDGFEWDAPRSDPGGQIGLNDMMLTQGGTLEKRSVSM